MACAASCFPSRAQDSCLTGLSRMSLVSTWSGADRHHTTACAMSAGCRDCMLLYLQQHTAHEKQSTSTRVPREHNAHMNKVVMLAGNNTPLLGSSIIAEAMDCQELGLHNAGRNAGHPQVHLPAARLQQVATSYCSDHKSPCSCPKLIHPTG